MFSSEDEKPPLTYFHVEYNITAISSWLKNKKDIPPANKWDKDAATKRHLITMLPMEPFLFYHNEINSFSPAIAGGESMQDEVFYHFEWGWTQTEFYVLVNNEEVIFLAPLEEFMYLLKNRRPKSMTGNALEDLEGGIIDINLSAENEYCRQIYQHSVFGAGVEFSNSLARISAVYVTASNIEIY